MATESVREDIAAAWAEEAYPGDDRIAYNTSARQEECNQVTGFFRGKHWRDITLESLAEEYGGDGAACLAFMTPEAYRFYLPAYMLISIDHPGTGDVLADAAVGSLAPWPDPTPRLQAWWAERVSDFSPAQRKVIVEFLRFLRERYAWGPPQLAAALRYWESKI